jgi:hypothetical protein
MRKQDGQGRNIWHLQHRWASSFRWIFTCENTLKRSFFFSNEHDFIWFPLFDILWFHSALRLPQQFEPISFLFPNPVLSSIGVQTGRLQFSYMSYLAWLFHRSWML